jgi:superfamily II DNA or RNA helicase
MSKTKDKIQKEALSALKDKRMAGVEISMGVGKTRIGLKHMVSAYTNYSKFLVVAPKKVIFESWKDEMKKINFGYLEEHIEYVTYLSLTKKELNYDCIYLDECHSLKASHNKWLKKYISKGGRIVGLTGTYPTYKFTEKGKMCNFYCPKVYEYLTDEAVGDNILNDYKIYIHELTLSNKNNIERSGKHGDFNTSEVKDYNYWTDRVDVAQGTKEKQIASIQRMKCLQKFQSKEHYAKLLFEKQSDKAIVFATEKAQADRLCINSVHSSNKKSKENLQNFKDGSILKCAAVQQLSEGITIPNLKVAIIMHSFGNNRQASQKIGRVLRLNPKDTATVHILCFTDTVDKDWVTNALASLNQDKIHWIKPIYYGGIHY